MKWALRNKTAEKRLKMRIFKLRTKLSNRNTAVLPQENETRFLAGIPLTIKITTGVSVDSLWNLERNI